MFTEDLYELLGINKNATQDEIKKAYRRQSKIHHPDAGGSDENFKKIAYAYDILSNKEKKDLYDKYGHDMGRSHGAGMSDNMADFIRKAQAEFMGGFGMRQEGPQPIKLNVQVSLKEVYHGTQKKYKYKANKVCSHCGGLRYVAKEGGSKENCKTCSGAGMVTTQNGFMMYTTTCPDCRGAGSKIINGCKTCSSSGYEKVEQTVNIDIPRGVPNNAHMALQGQGNQEMINGKLINGDLIVFISDMKDESMVRDGNDIHMKSTTPILDCILGSDLKIKTIDDRDLSVKIPIGTDSGHKLRIAGAGMPIYGTNSYGDLYIHIEHKMKKNLTEKEIETLKILKETW